MKNYTLFLCFLLCSSTTFTYGQRFIADVFEQIDSITLTYAQKGDDTLQLDLYLPKNDTMSTRPLVIYLHGGGFSGGQRDGDRIKSFGQALSRKGYAVASASYRLVMKGQSFSCDQPSPNKISTFQSVVQDIRDATVYLLGQSEKYRLDPAHFILAGSSAGAEAIVHAAFWEDDQLPEGTTPLPDGFRYAGMISMAGAIVETKLITRENALPSLLFHGTCDNLVPYATAPHHYCQAGEVGYLILHGAKSIAERLEHLGQPYYLFTSCNGNHSWASRPMWEELPTIVDFLYRDVLKREFRQIHRVVYEEGDCEYFEEPFKFCEN